jgi:hypothetical protein
LLTPFGNVNPQELVDGSRTYQSSRAFGGNDYVGNQRCKIATDDCNLTTIRLQSR